MKVQQYEKDWCIKRHCGQPLQLHPCILNTHSLLAPSALLHLTMTNPNGLCAMAINELQANGSYVNYWYWAHVVQMNDPRLPARPRIEVDLVHEWIAGVEPGAGPSGFSEGR